MFDIGPYKKEIERLCETFGIAKLEIFGSAVTDEFRPDSDVDVVIEFDGSGGNHFHRYFDLKYALEELFGREVDIVVGDAMRNPYFKAEVKRTKKPVYVG